MVKNEILTGFKNRKGLRSQIHCLESVCRAQSEPYERNSGRLADRAMQKTRNAGSFTLTKTRIFTSAEEVNSAGSLELLPP